MWRFWVPSSSSARELQAFLESCPLWLFFIATALLKFSLFLRNGLRISLERTVSILLLCCISFVLSEPLYSVIFTLSGSLVSFYIFTFSSVVPSLEHKHSLCSETGLVRATPDKKFALVPCAARIRLVRATPNQKLASVLCATRTGLVPQHLTKTTRWLSSGMWKIGLERLAPDQK